MVELKPDFFGFFLSLLYPSLYAFRRNNYKDLQAEEDYCFSLSKQIASESFQGFGTTLYTLFIFALLNTE